MAGYNEIKGLRVKYLSADPAGAEDGQVWYNSTTGNLRVQGIGVGAWSSASPMITAKGALGGAGIQTAAMVFGAPGASTATEEYNGSGFSVGGTLNTGRGYMAGCGTQTAGLGFGGYTSAPNTAGQALTEEYDGSSWTAGGTLNTSRYDIGAAGIQTAGLAFGGYNNTLPPGNVTNSTEEYNGSSWTNSPGTLGTARYGLAGAGLQTAAIAALGYKYGSPLRTTSTEEYDGSTWTAGSNATTERSSLKGGGIQTSFLVFGGFAPPYSAVTEAYNGTSWSNQPSLATARNRMGAASNTPGSSTGLCAGGQTPSATAATEEYNFSASTVTAAAWSSAPSIGTGRYLGGYGITPTNASIIFGGHTTTSVANTEEYNGTSWAENPDMNTARSRINGFGTQTAAVTMGGRQVGVPPNVNMNNTELYDGSSWTNGPTYPLTAKGIGGAGTNAAGLAIAAWTGSPPGFTTCNDWNGSGWTAAEANLNTARGYVSGWGTQSDAGAAGGPPGNTDYEEYNGSSWTTKASLVTATGAPSGGAAGFGGTPGAIKANGNGGTFSQQWNGTSWGTAASRANTNYGGGMSGGNTAASGIVTGGYIYPSTGPATGSEEFTGETTTVNPASNITTS